MLLDKKKPQLLRAVKFFLKKTKTFVLILVNKRILLIKIRLEFLYGKCRFSKLNFQRWGSTYFLNAETGSVASKANVEGLLLMKI